MVRIPFIRSVLLVALAALPLCGCGQKTNTGIPDDVNPVTTASGLVYSVLEPGMSGRTPQLGDWAMVHYTGWLGDGTRFDSTSKRQPVGFMIGKAPIEAWNEVAQLMQPGARFKVTARPELAYGARGNLPRIPPNTTLILVLELVSVTPGPPFAAPDAALQKTTASGLKYQVLEPGDGAAPRPDQVVELSYGLWNTQGRLLRYTPYEIKKPKAKPGQFRPAVLAEAAHLMPRGARYLFEVPPELGFGSVSAPHLPPDSVTVWEVTMVSVIEPLPLPAFVAPVPEKMAVTVNGIRYEITEEGGGAPPRANQVVQLHYALWLPDGTPVDSSFSRGEPLRLRFGQPGIGGWEVIPAWNQCIAMLKRGAVARFVVPAELAFGAKGSPPAIGPDQELVIYMNRLP